jgi:hypothetical protein
MFNYAIEFERKFGTLDELEAIEQRYKEKVASIPVVIAEEASMNQERPAQTNDQGRPIKRRFEEHEKEHAGSSISNQQDHLRDNKRMMGDPTLRGPVFGDSK